MNRLAKRIWASGLFPRFSPLVERLNHAALFKDWVRATELPRVESRYVLYDRVLSIFPRDSPFDFVEFGVWKGDSLRHWTRLSADPRNRFFGFDSFAGLPEDWIPGISKGAFDTGGVMPDIPDPRVQIIPGRFQQVLPGFLDRFRPQSNLIIHFDADLYSSTLYCLAMMDRVMARGTVAIFDEFGQPLHEFRAFEDFCQSFGRKFRPLGATFDSEGVPDAVGFVRE